MALKAALILPAVVMIGAVAFDLARVHAARVRLQDIADSGAVAGARALTPTATNAAGRARDHVEARLQAWEGRPTVEAVYEVVESRGRPAVQVRLHGRRPSFFASFLPPGGWTFDARATVTAPPPTGAGTSID